MKKKSIIVRSSPEFKKMLNEIKLKRIKNGKNKEMLSDRRLTKAITNVPELKDLLENWEIKND